jgi:hypothetical protein
MIQEDHRNISCGGDPFNYLKSVLKGINIQLEPGQDAEILVLKEKFPYSKGTYEGLAKTTKLSLVDVKEAGPDVQIFVRKPKE